MNIEHIYAELDSHKSEPIKEGILRDYLKQRLSSLPVSAPERRKVAYDIAGLLSTSYAKTLEDNSPYEQILTLAGELEVSESDNAQKWTDLLELAAALYER